MELGRFLLRIALILGLIGSVVFILMVPGGSIIFVLMLVLSLVGAFIWSLIGSKAYIITHKLILLPFRKFMTKRLYLLRPPEKKEKPVIGHFLEAIDDSFLPMLLVFGILALFANYLPADLLSSLEVVFLIILFPATILGLIFPILKILLDSDLIIVDLDGRRLEPVGTKILTYMRSIAGVTAIVSFVSNILSRSGQLEAALGALIFVFVATYPTIVLILLLYNRKHDNFVEKLNMLLRRELKYADVTITAKRKGTMGTIKLTDEAEVILPSWYSESQQVDTNYGE